MKEKKATFIILAVVLLLIIIVLIPAIIIGRKSSNEKNFPEFEELDVNENIVNNTGSEEYTKLRKQLEKDYYFAKESLINNFDYEKYNGSNFRELLWNFIFSYELENKETMSSINKKEGVFCLTKNNLLSAFKELYNIDITNQLDLILGYHEYVYMSNGNYCFIYQNISNEYDNEIKVAVERMAMMANEITTDIYVYEYYTNYTEEEKSNINILNSYISNTDYESAKNVVLNYLKGKVTHKQLKLKVNNYGKYFKYKILSSKILEY